MNKLKQAYIPSEIQYLYTDSKEIKIGNKIIKVFPAFQTDPIDTRTIGRAIDSKFFKNFLKENDHDISKIKKIKYSNTEIKNISIVSIHPREYEKGGAVIKCVLSYEDINYLVDMKLNIFMDCVQNGMNKNAQLRGTFQWVKYSYRNKSYLRLIRIGSEDHKNVLKYKENLSKKSLKKKDFKPGYIYYSRKHEKYLFCGFVDGTTYSNSKMNKFGSMISIMKEKDFKDRMLFYKLDYTYKVGDKIEFEEENFSIKNDNSLIAGSKIKVNFPIDVCSHLRNFHRGKLKEKFVTNPNAEYYYIDYINKFKYFLNVHFKSEIINKFYINKLNSLLTFT